MKIVHRIAAASGGQFWKAIDHMGLEYERGTWCVLNISEDHDQWQEVKELEERFEPETHLIFNRFTKREMDAADWFEIGAKGHYGYPQPEDDFTSFTYNTDNWCSKCGIGWIQNAPFRLRKKPNKKRTQFLQLNWVFDEFFVPHEVAAVLAEAGVSGIEFLPPVLHKTSEPCDGLLQMRVKSDLVGGLDSGNLDRTLCLPSPQGSDSPSAPAAPIADSSEYCGRSKFLYMHRGPFVLDASALADAPDVVKSREWFGSGAEARKLVLVSKAFRDLVVSQKWRGLGFEPVRLSDGPA